MRLDLDWHNPIRLRLAGYREKLIYDLDLDEIPELSGIYVFGRQYGKSFEALYVGKATNLRRRLTRQLNNLALMRHVQNAHKGKRVVVIGIFRPGPKQKPDKCIGILEKACIRHFLAKGDDLSNVRGTSLWQHEIISVGLRHVPKTMHVSS